jgi:dTMP kinase
VVFGRFIAIEGVDGSGKSTQIARLAAALREKGHSVVVTREPGGTVFGERLRGLLLGSDSPKISPEAEALGFAASRAQLVSEVIRPALASGAWVVSDRFVDSSLAYQGSARGLGVERVRAANAIAVDGCLPDLVVVLDIPVGEARARETGPDDRIESEGSDLQERVAVGYRLLADESPERIVLVPATGSAEEVACRVIALVEERLV